MCSLPEPQKTLLLPVHPAGRRQYDPFFWFLFSLYPFLAVLPAGKMLLMLSAYRRLFRKITAKPH